MDTLRTEDMGKAFDACVQKPVHPNRWVGALLGQAHAQHRVKRSMGSAGIDADFDGRRAER